MLNRITSSFRLAAVLTAVLLLALQITEAQVMNSASYQLQSDSINVGGGLSSSTNYVQESTVGEIATGPSDSTTYRLRAGYQQMQEVFLSLSVPTDVVMDTDIGGLTGGTSNGSTTVTVITDSPSGYQLTILAENDPAMQSPDDTIADYSAGGTPDFVFTTTASDAHFGYSPSGVDITSEFRDDGGACGTGSGDVDLACWDGLTTVARAIAESGTANQPTGATTTVNFRVGIGSSGGKLAGVYIATSTLTALPL